MINLMILFVLLKRDLTMYAIRKHIQDKFSPYTNPSFGALKPALTKLEKQGYLTTSKMMSNGGKLSVFYSITNSGQKELKELLVAPMSVNPLQFLSDAKVKLCCASFLGSEDKKRMYEEIKSKAYLFLAKAKKISDDEYVKNDFYQKIVFDNTICEYKNFISMIEGLEKA
jgi:DNA-binding PadR family transcriptional regulator